MAPFFEADPANYTILLNLTRNTFDNALYVGDTVPLRYQLPAPFDAYPDIVTVTANTAAYPYIQVENKTRELVFDPAGMIPGDVGDHVVDLFLTDNHGNSRKYKFYLKVEAYEAKTVSLSSDFAA